MNVTRKLDELLDIGIEREMLRWIVEGMTQDAAANFALAGIAQKENRPEDAKACLIKAKKLLELLAQVDMESL